VLWSIKDGKGLNKKHTFYNFSGGFAPYMVDFCVTFGCSFMITHVEFKLYFQQGAVQTLIIVFNVGVATFFAGSF
jgi:hypothetical protein